MSPTGNGAIANVAFRRPARPTARGRKKIVLTSKFEEHAARRPLRRASSRYKESLWYSCHNVSAASVYFLAALIFFCAAWRSDHLAKTAAGRAVGTTNVSAENHAEAYREWWPVAAARGRALTLGQVGAVEVGLAVLDDGLGDALEVLGEGHLVERLRRLRDRMGQGKKTSASARGP